MDDIVVDLDTRITYKNANRKWRYIEILPKKDKEGAYRWKINKLAWEAMMWESAITVEEYKMFEEWMDEAGHDYDKSTN